MRLRRGELARAPGQFSEPCAVDEGKIGSDHGEPELSQAKDEIDAKMKQDHGSDDERAQLTDPDKDWISRLQEQTTMCRQVQQRGISCQPDKVEASKLGRDEDHLHGRPV